MKRKYESLYKIKKNKEKNKQDSIYDAPMWTHRSSMQVIKQPPVFKSFTNEILRHIGKLNNLNSYFRGD